MYLAEFTSIGLWDDAGVVPKGPLLPAQMGLHYSDGPFLVDKQRLEDQLQELRIRLGAQQDQANLNAYRAPHSQREGLCELRLYLGPLRENLLALR